MKSYLKNHCIYREKDNGIYLYIHSMFHRFNKGYLPQLLLFTFLLIYSIKPAYIFAQYRFKITGKVTDTITKKPIYMANVFLANTTLGSTTNKNGMFVIKNIPSGNYELLVSMMGYKVEKKSVKIFPGSEKYFNFELKPTVLQGEKVTVTAKFPKEWRRNLKIFKRIFFGKSEFAGKCKFKNPEVLNFKYNRKTGQFTATTDRPLVFINKALGYEITVLLDKYNAELFNDDLYEINYIEATGGVEFKKGNIVCISNNFFKELIPKNDKQRKKWKENRRIAYNGSKYHFLKSLVSGTWKNEGFEICGAKNFSKLFDYSLDIKKLLRKAENDDYYILSFPKLLKVIYKKESDKIRYEYRKEMIEFRPDSPGRDDALAELAAECIHQISFLEIVNGSEVFLNSNGRLISNTSELVAYGYWSWDSIAESLPRDYLPHQEFP